MNGRIILTILICFCLSGIKIIQPIGTSSGGAASGPDFRSHVDMVSYWLLDADENPLQDGTANNRDLALKGAGEPNYDASFVPNGGYDFDGTDDYAEYDGAIGITIAPVSIYARCRIDSGSAQSHTVVFLGDKDSGGKYYRLQISSTDYPQANSRNPDNVQATSSEVMTEGTWYSLVAVYYSSSSRKIFVNGIERGNDANSASPADLDRVAIGISRDSTPGNALKGDISECAYFDDDLTQQEITDISTYGIEGNGF